MDALPLFEATVDGETVDFLALSTDSNVDDVLEMLFVREVIALRQADVEAYELVWDTVRALLARGAPIDAVEA